LTKRERKVSIFQFYGLKCIQMRFYTRENEIRLNVDYREIDVSPFQIHPVVLPRKETKKQKKNKNNQHTDKQNKNKKQ